MLTGSRPLFWLDRKRHSLELGSQLQTALTTSAIHNTKHCIFNGEMVTTRSNHPPAAASEGGRMAEWGQAAKGEATLSMWVEWKK